MKVLLITLSDRHLDKALQIIRSKYPDCDVTTFTKQELFSKSLLEIIKIFRTEKYFLSIIFSDGLINQTKIFFLKIVLLLAKAKNKKIMDNYGNEKRVNLGEFVFKSVPLFILESIFTIILLIGLFLILKLFLLHLKLTKHDNKNYLNKGSRNVVFLRSEYVVGNPAGGMNTYYKGFAEGIKACGYNVIFISSGGLELSNVPVYVIKFWRLFNSFSDTPQLIYNFSYFWHSYKILRKEPPVFLFQISEQYNFAGALLARLLKVPFFLNIHDLDIWKGYFRDKIYLTYYSKLIEDVSIRAADIIFVVSGVLKEELIKKNIQQKIIIKPMGCNFNLFNPQNSNGQKIRGRYQLGNKIVVGYVGSFSVNHGLEVLAQTIKLVIDKNHGIHFLLVGDGVCYAKIKQLIYRENLKNNVTLTGAIPLEQIPAYLDACDICVAPYTKFDNEIEFFGTPSKAFEYMAMQKGIIISDLKPVREIMTDGEEGLLIEAGNSAKLAKSILNLADNQPLRAKLGKQARKKVLKNYSWKAVEGKVITAYEDLITCASRK